MKLAIVSLMTGVPWGGSEESWAAAARDGACTGHRSRGLPSGLAGSAREGAASGQEWRKHRALAALEPSLKARLAAKLLHPSSSLDRQIKQAAADAFVVSLGSDV